jgi:hypothetical protein
MDKLLEYCQLLYEKELGYAISLANVITWLIFVVSVHVFYELNISSLYSGLNIVRLGSLFDLSDGVFAQITILQVTASLAFVAAVAWLTREISEGLFYLFTLKSDFGQLIIEITLKYISKNTFEKKDELEKAASARLELSQKRFRKYKNLAEISLAFALSSFVGLEFNLANAAIALVAMLLFLLVTWRSFHVFIEDILPYFVAINYSKNKLTDIRDAFDAHG